jgi:hypothetical protein
MRMWNQFVSAIHTHTHTHTHTHIHTHVNPKNAYMESVCVCLYALHIRVHLYMVQAGHTCLLENRKKMRTTSVHVCL